MKPDDIVESILESIAMQSAKSKNHEERKKQDKTAYALIRELYNDENKAKLTELLSKQANLTPKLNDVEEELLMALEELEEKEQLADHNLQQKIRFDGQAQKWQKNWSVLFDH